MTIQGNKSQPDVLFQIVNGHVLKANSFGTVNIVGISENANRHARPRDIGKSVNRNTSTKLFPERMRAKTYLTVPEKRLSL